MTGLGNRASFDVAVPAMLLRALAARQALALVLVDLDDFHLVNDALGYLAGDHLLVEASRRLRRCANDADRAVPLGGDEFVFVLVGSTPSDAEGVARRMLNLLSERDACRGAGSRVPPRPTARRDAPPGLDDGRRGAAAVGTHRGGSPCRRSTSSRWPSRRA